MGRRARSSAALALAFVALFGAQIRSASAFKASDFKTCATSSFCERHRHVPAHDPRRAHRLVGRFAVGDDGAATATVERSNPSGDADDRPLSLTVTPYGDEGVIRVRFDDDARPRYEVPDVLVDSLDASQRAFDAVTHDAGTGTTTFVVRANLRSVPGDEAKDYRLDDDKSSDDATERVIKLVVTHNPLRVALSVNGRETAVFNDEGRFDFERERSAPGPDETWKETFNGHTDTRPRGPMAVVLDLSFPGDDVHVYGIPERATSLSLRDTAEGREEGDERSLAGEAETDDAKERLKKTSYSEPYRLYNLDVFEYEHDSPFGLYGSIPVMHARSRYTSKSSPKKAKKGGKSEAREYDGEVFYSGVYVHNPTETYVEVRRDGGSHGSGAARTLWMSESGAADFFFLPGPSPGAVARQYSRLTGTSAMPPAFSLGYHQCRWNYRDEADVKEVDGTFDELDIPYDVLWLDIEHTDGKRYMTWDAAHFPTPRRMIEDVASRGRKMVTIVDPHVKKDPNYPTHAEAERKRLYVRTPTGEDFDGWCWPGSSAYLDVVSSAVRDWWAEKFSLANYPGSTHDLHVWNDMNEPSVFNGPEITMRKDLTHVDGTVEHREVHNAFGMYYHAATAQGLRMRKNAEETERPLVLSRAFFAGSQRVGPVWTGDNAADWDHLRVSIPMTLTLGVAGLTWSGADVGGFFGDPDPELATRWYQLGAFYPFFRGHAHLDTKRREPWMFGEPYTGFIRNAIRRRYALMPYLYTLFEEAHRTGAPVLRAMWYEFPDDDVVAAKDDVAMLGPALLVAPVLFKNAQERSTYLPAGTWYDYDTGEKFEGPTTVTKPTTIEDAPLYVRGGFVVPRRDRARRSVAAARGDPLTLLVAPDEFGNAVGDVYFDDGIGYGYLAEGGLETKKTSETSRFRKGSVGKNAPFGAFTRRVFSFTDGVLNCGAPSYSPSASGAGGDFPDAATRVERVVVMGADVSAYASTAEVRVFSKGEKEKDARTFRVDVERAATSERGGEKTSARAVAARKPDVAVADDWSVAFFFES